MIIGIDFSLKKHYKCSENQRALNLKIRYLPIFHLSMKLQHFCNKFSIKESLGEPAIHFKDQNYDELLSEHNEDNLFEDPEFLADESTLYSNSFTDEIIWMRPHVQILKLLNLIY